MPQAAPNVDLHAADIQDRNGAETLLRQARRRFPFIERILADGSYAGAKMRALVARTGSWDLQIVKRTDAGRFVVLQALDRRAHARLDQRQPPPVSKRIIWPTSI